MPTQIQKSDFPPFEEWEEMEIVEDIGTSDEHADPFYRWNNYGIEVHEDGLCQAYVIIQDPEEGEIPKKVAEGFDSPEAVIEYFRNTEHQKELVDGGEMAEEPEEVAEIEAEPVPEEEPEVMPPEAPAPGEPTEKLEEKSEEGKEEAPEKKEGDEKEDEKDDEDEKDKKKVKKSESEETPAETSVQKSAPQPEADPFPPIKSFAEIREEYYRSHSGSAYIPSTPAEHTQRTVAKTSMVNKMTDKPTENTPIAKSESTPVVKSIKFGETIPSWQDIKNGYRFEVAAPAPATAPIAKAEAAGSPPPEQMPADVPAEGGEMPAEGGDITPEDIQNIAQALDMSPEEIEQMLQSDEGRQQLLQMIQEILSSEGSEAEAASEEPEITDDGLQRQTTTPDIGL